MPKTDSTFDPTQYAPVADRIALFFESYPHGRIVTKLARRTRGEVIFRAAVYRDGLSLRPAATGWAAEREGDGDVNTVACLENTETSAIGRALANLGFTASSRRPSREEMEKAARRRARVARAAGSASDRLQSHADAATDLLDLIRRAELAALRPARAARWRAAVRGGALAPADIERCERRLRGWLARQERALSPAGN